MTKNPNQSIGAKRSNVTPLSRWGYLPNQWTPEHRAGHPTLTRRMQIRRARRHRKQVNRHLAAQELLAA